MKPLKRKENALRLSLRSFVGSENGWTESRRKNNENNMLDYRFSVAPMMDWSESAIFSMR
jgi:hypothetical protein